MLLANLQIGFHEQTRLQPEIAESLDTCVPDPASVKRRLIEALLSGSEHALAGRLAREDRAGACSTTYRRAWSSGCARAFVWW